MEPRINEHQMSGLSGYRGFGPVRRGNAAYIQVQAVCDRLARIVGKLGLASRAVYWREHADRIHAGILDKAWNSQGGFFASSFGGDASLLLILEVGFLPGNEPKFLAKLDAVEKHLRFGNHVYRFRKPDDFGEPETAFSACTFGLIDTLAQVGRKDDARSIFEDVLAHRNHLGLLSEGLHVDTVKLWDNFPQTYSMVGLINAAMHLSRSWEDNL